MLYCMITPQMKASDVCHMQPSLPWILSCLLIHLPFPSHSSCLLPVYSHLPATPGMCILPIARCQTCHGTLLSKCTTGVSPLRVLLFFFFSDETWKKVLSLKHLLFLSMGRQNSWEGEWQLQSLLVHAAPWRILLANSLIPEGAAIFYVLYNTSI